MRHYRSAAEASIPVNFSDGQFVVPSLFLPHSGYNDVMYEHFEHTADLGMRVRAASLDALFADAGRGLFAMIIDNPEAIRPMESVQFEVIGSDREYLLFDWLNELLYTFESRHLLLGEFDVQFTDHGLAAIARGETLDPIRHQLGHEVKAITYHQFRVAETKEGWEAELIVDI